MNARVLLGIRGDKGHGKDTLARFLVEDHGYVRAAFADRLKRAAQVIYGLTDEQVHGTLEQKETVDPRWGLSPREILQRLGTEVGRNIHPDTWVKGLLDVEIPQREAEVHAMYHVAYGQFATWPDIYWAVTDVRFSNEADAIRARDGYIVEVIRPGFSTGAHEAHASETEGRRIVPDFVVVNDGTLDEFRNKARSLANIMRAEASR